MVASHPGLNGEIVQKLVEEDCRVENVLVTTLFLLEMEQNVLDVQLISGTATYSNAQVKSQKRFLFENNLWFLGGIWFEYVIFPLHTLIF